MDDSSKNRSKLKAVKNLKKIKVKDISKKGGFFGTTEVIIASCISIILGLALLFVPQIQIITICYSISTVMVAAGIIFIVKYFLAEGYLNMNEYGFSIGVLMVVLGMCALVREEQVASFFILCIGGFVLISGIIKLQYSMALKIVEDKLWIVLLLVSFIIMGLAITIILDPFSSKDTLQTFTYYILIIDGILSIICNIYLFWYLKNYGKREMKEELKQQLINEEVPIQVEEGRIVQSDSGEHLSTGETSEDKKI
jgi:uncharacterized membrane protein HdeD (DUF308 family)